MRRFVLLFGLVYVAVALPSTPTPQLTFDGYGQVKFGLTVTDAARILKNRPTRTNTEESDSCYYVRFAAYPGVDFMVENGHVVRADPLETSSNILGLKIGMSVSEVRERFKDRKLELHEYGDGGHYLAFPSPNGKAEIWVEVSRDKVIYVRGGLLPAVEYIEGCL
jgi:hypothetical protein